MNLIEFVGQHDDLIYLKVDRTKDSYYVTLNKINTGHSLCIYDGSCAEKGFFGRGTTLLNALNDLSEKIRNRRIGDNFKRDIPEGIEVPDLKRMYCIEDIFEDLLKIHNLRYGILKELNK